jgi:hypothetical protein
MGALSAEQLARVIALEIQHNIQEKSMAGHVAQDAAYGSQIRDGAKRETAFPVLLSVPVSPVKKKLKRRS